MKKKLGPSTRSVHLMGHEYDRYHTIVPPVFENVAFCYDDIESWRTVALKTVSGHIYSRNSNPTTDLFEKKISALEGTEAATSFATGMAAINCTLFSLLIPGKRAVSVRDAYGATYLHFKEILPRFQVDCMICETDDENSIENAITSGCDVLYLESPTNPTLKILDLERLIGMARKVGAITIVDNTFATPLNQSPISLGADLVVHSATKFLCGHGDAMGGVVCGKKALIEKINRYRELTGPSMDPRSASLLLRSLKTLGLRVERQNKNALALARFLCGQKKVTRVFYPGLGTHPGHEIAARQMSGFGGILSFELRGGFEAVCRFLPRLRLAFLAANLGQVETVVGPPSTTSHVELTETERREAGIPEGLIRYSVGIEDIDDLIEDISQALQAL